MCPDQHENQSDPELLIDVEESEIVRDGFAVRVRGGGTVRYFGDGFKTPEIAWEAGREFVKKFLRAQLQQATGVSVRAERPAFEGGMTEAHVAAGVAAVLAPICAACGRNVACEGDTLCSPCGGLYHPPGWQLEGELLCTCGHSDGEHILGANGCNHGLGGPGRPFCPCGEFTPVAQVEAVR